MIVLNVNLWCDGPNLEGRLEAVKELIREKDPDVILFQECYIQPAIDMINSLSDYQVIVLETIMPEVLGWVISSGRGPYLNFSGLAMAYKGLIDSQHKATFTSAGYNGWHRWFKNAFFRPGWMYIELPDVTIATCHITLNETFDGTLSTGQRDQIMEIMATLNKRHDRVVLMGDFNHTVDQYNISGSFGFTVADTEMTWRKDNPYNKKEAYDESRDIQCWSRGVKCSVHVLSDWLVSDHYPVLVHI